MGRVPVVFEPKGLGGAEAFPLTGSGKIQKFKLREFWAKGEMQEI
jgi:fatty-acyl-CoA synthase